MREDIMKFFLVFIMFVLSLGFVFAVPLVSNVVLSSSLGTNLTTDNLSVSFDSVNATTNITDWRVNGVSWAQLNLPFDTEVSSGMVRDYSTFENNATIFANPSWISDGKIGGAYSFSNGSDYLKVDYDNQSFNMTDSFTIMLWVRRDGDQLHPTYAQILGTIDGIATTTKAFGMWVSSGTNLRVNIGDGITNQDLNEFNLFANNDTNWHFIAFSYDRSDSEYLLYIDGEVSSNPAVVALPNATNDGWFIGRASTLFPFNGSIDNLVFTNNALSTDVLDSIYEQQNLSRDLTTISADATSSYEVWSVAVTPNNQSEDGVTVLSSNNITIQPISIPTLADLRSDNIDDVTNSNVRGYCSADDGVSTSVTATWTLYLNGASNSTSSYGTMNGQGTWYNVVNISSSDFSSSDSWTLVCDVTDGFNLGSANASLTDRSPAEFFVALNGSDSTGDGSTGSPWATISYALANVQEGDNITFKSGVYDLSKNWVRQAITIYKNVGLRAEVNQNSTIKINESFPYAVIYWSDVAGGVIDGLVINSSGYQSNSQFALRFDPNTDNFTLMNSLLDGALNYSLYIDSGFNWLVYNNSFFMDNISENVIFINEGNTITISENTFGSSTRRINESGETSIYVTVNSNDTSIINNDFYHDLGLTIIYFAGNSNNSPSYRPLVTGNYFNFISNTLSYTIAVGEDSPSFLGGIRDAVVSHNYLVNPTSDTSSPNHGIFLGRTYNSELVNNTVINAYYNFVLKANTNLTVINSSTINASFVGMYDKGSWNSIFEGTYFEGGSRALIGNNSGDPARVLTINSTWINNNYGTGSNTFQISAGDATVINSSHSVETLGSGASLTRKWYYQGLVLDNQSNAVSGATISAYNSSGSLVNSSSTGSAGYSGFLILTEYSRLGSAFTYAENYTINVSYSSQSQLSELYNASLEENSLNNTFYFSSLNVPSDDDDGGSGGSSGGGGGGGRIPLRIQLLASQLAEGYNTNLYRSDSLRFTIDGDEHLVRLEKIVGGKATITVASDPMTFEMAVDEVKKVDLDADGVYDLMITLNSISSLNTYASLSVIRISEPVEEVDDEVVEEVPPIVKQPSKSVKVADVPKVVGDSPAPLVGRAFEPLSLISDYSFVFYVMGFVLVFGAGVFYFRRIHRRV